MSISYSKTKGMMNRCADKFTGKTNNDGVSAFAKERLISALTKRSGADCTVIITHADICKDARMSKSHSENALKSLKRDGEVFVTYTYRYCDRLKKRIVAGTNVVLVKIRQAVKEIISKSSDLTAKRDAQLLYTHGNRRKTKIIERQMLWMSDETGKLIKKTTERIRCTA